MAALGFGLPKTAFTSLMKQVNLIVHLLQTDFLYPLFRLFTGFLRNCVFDMNLTIFTVLQGPHLLAPTGSDLSKYGDLNNVFAGYHYDLNFLTIHGRCRFPGLFIWLKDGRKVPVKVPEGCLLLQAGKQVSAFHDVWIVHWWIALLYVPMISVIELGSSYSL